MPPLRENVISPRRWSTQTHVWAYRYLVLRDGEQCQECGAVPEARSHDVDHVDGDPQNNHPTNLRLLCRSCNVAAGNRSRLHETVNRLNPTPSVQVSERETADTNRAVGTQVAREAVDYQQGPPEMKANDLYEMPFRTWVLRQVDKATEPSTAEELVHAGAETVGCAIVTAARYLAKLTSSAGPLQEQRDMLHQRIVTRRAPPE